MSHITAAAITIVCELLMYFIVGGILPFAARDEKKSFFETVIAGWIITTAVFGIASVIAARFNVGLTTFSYVMTCVMSVLMAASLVINFRSIFRGTSVASGGVHFFFTVFFVIAISCGSAVLTILLPAAPDPGQIIAQMTADLSSDTIGVMIPGTGIARTVFTAPELLVRYSVFDTVVCKLNGLHPMIQMRVVRTAVTALLFGMIAYRIFMRIFNRHVAKASAAAFLAIFAGIGFRTAFTPSGLLYSQGWTGNSQLANVLLPSLILIAAALNVENSGLRPALLLIASGIAAVSLTPISLMVWPAAAAALVIPAVIIGKHLKYLAALVLSLVVPVAAVLLYLNYQGLPV